MTTPTDLTVERVEEILAAAKKATPGMWMAAAAPSSVVGWPIVGQQGRAIASVHCAMQKPPAVSDEEWQAYRNECEANARLIETANPATITALCNLALDTLRRTTEAEGVD